MSKTVKEIGVDLVLQLPAAEPWIARAVRQYRKGRFRAAAAAAAIASAVIAQDKKAK